MKPDEIKALLRRSATIFETGGKQPSNQLLESWIGSVRWKLEDEQIPVDKSGNTMMPVATLFLKGLPFVSEALKGIELVEIFISTSFFDHLVELDLSPWFAIRTYNSIESLLPCRWDAEHIKPFPLTPKLIENDYPVWDGGGIPFEVEEEILRLEEETDFDYFDDISEGAHAVHKIGGWPAFCQSGIEFGDGYEFVLQISSDQKAQFNIVDTGNFYFYYNSKRDDWKVYCDFY